MGTKNGQQAFEGHGEVPMVALQEVFIFRLMKFSRPAT